MTAGTDRGHEPIAFVGSDRFALLQDIADAVIVADAVSGLIVFWNRAAERLLGYSSEEALALTAEMIVVPRIRPLLRATLGEFALTGGLPTLAEQRPLTLPVLCKEGSKRRRRPSGRVSRSSWRRSRMAFLPATVPVA